MIPYNNMNLVAIIDVLFHSELIDGTLRECTNFKFRLDFETTLTTNRHYSVRFDVMNSSGVIEEKEYIATNGTDLNISIQNSLSTNNTAYGNYTMKVYIPKDATGVTKYNYYESKKENIFFSSLFAN